MSTKSMNPETWRLKTPLREVPYKIVNRSGTFAYDSVSVTEEVIIEASRLQDFVRESFPFPILDGGVPVWVNRALAGDLPIKVSDISWGPHVDGVPSDPFNADTSAPDKTYQKFLRVTVTYSDDQDTPKDPDENDPTTFLEITAHASGEFLHSPSPKASTKNDETEETTPVDEPDLPLTLVIPKTEWSVKWPLINLEFFREVMVVRMRAAMGKVNDGTYPLLYNAPAETLLFVGWEISENHQFRFADEVADSITARYVKNPIDLSAKILEKHIDWGKKDKKGNSIYYGHNHIWKPKDGGWRRLFINGNEPMFQAYDFGTLFTGAVV